jgi:tetratricopeptide (TPR) repeat protein
LTGQIMGTAGNFWSFEAPEDEADFYRNEYGERVARDASTVTREVPFLGLANKNGNAMLFDAGAELLRSWNTSHPTDLLSGGYELEYVSRMGETGFDRTREVARRILDTPTLPTGIDASIQSETRARAIQVLIDSAIVQAAREGIEPAKKAELESQLPGLRADLLKSLQNDESAPGMLIADAKILQSRGDLPAAAKKWEIYFQKVPQPPADAFLWSAMVSRAQNDLGLAMQTATRGSDAYPSDLRLAIQRAELAAQLGKFAEAAALFEALAKAIPSEQRFAGAGGLSDHYDIALYRTTRNRRRFHTRTFPAGVQLRDMRA